ncbi:MAG: HdeD family acid-resistance protein [Eubacterium sp.]|jgi:uncharacterized membrane protein HdeD (DUF308 family)
MKIVKSAKYAYVTVSAAMAVIGAVLTGSPSIGADYALKLVGIVCVVFGIVKFVGFFSQDLFGLAFQYDLAEGIITVIAGIFSLTKPERTPEALAAVVGMIALVDGSFKVQTSLDARKFGMRYWGMILFLAALTASFGLALLFGDAEGETAIEDTGMALIVTGLQNIWMVFYTVRLFRGGKMIDGRDDRYGRDCPDSQDGRDGKDGRDGREDRAACAGGAYRPQRRRGKRENA